jgi:hypothetical protein
MSPKYAQANVGAVESTVADFVMRLDEVTANYFDAINGYRPGVLPTRRTQCFGVD